MTYLLDANVFITAKNAHYGMDFAPAFWDWITQQHRAGLVFTVESVGDEIKGGSDELAEWAAKLPNSFYVAVDAAALTRLTDLSAWVTAESRYTSAARSTFLSKADYYLVGQAKALGYTVVTHETPDAQSKKIVKIPDACKGLGVPYMQPWQMLRDEGARFVL